MAGKAEAKMNIKMDMNRAKPLFRSQTKGRGLPVLAPLYADFVVRLLHVNYFRVMLVRSWFPHTAVQVDTEHAHYS